MGQFTYVKSELSKAQIKQKTNGQQANTKLIILILIPINPKIVGITGPIAPNPANNALFPNLIKNIYMVSATTTKLIKATIGVNTVRICKTDKTLA